MDQDCLDANPDFATYQECDVGKCIVFLCSCLLVCKISATRVPRPPGGMSIQFIMIFPILKIVAGTYSTLCKYWVFVYLLGFCFFKNSHVLLL